MRKRCVIGMKVGSENYGDMDDRRHLTPEEVKTALSMWEIVRKCYSFGGKMSEWSFLLIFEIQQK